MILVRVYGVYGHIRSKKSMLCCLYFVYRINTQGVPRYNTTNNNPSDGYRSWLAGQSMNGQGVQTPSAASVQQETHSFIVMAMLGLALVAKTRPPHRPQALKKVKNGQALPYENNIFSHCFFWRSRLQVLSGTPVKSFAQVFEYLTAYGQY